MHTYVIEQWKYQAKMERSFNDISWVIKVRAKDDIRPALQTIEVRDGNFVACDGYQIHYAAITGDSLPETMMPENGLYEVVSATKKAITLRSVDPSKVPGYPEWINALPAGESTDILFDTGKDQITKLCHVIYRNQPADQTVNHRYIENLKTDELHTEWTMHLYGKGKPIAFTNCNKLALIMPITGK